MQQIKDFLRNLGELRTFLALSAFFSLANTPFTSTDVRMEGWGLMPDVLAPVVTTILIFVLLLDMLMSRVFSAEASEEKRQRFRRIFWFEFALVISLIVCWAPYLTAILS